jgi:hypothetical protein
LLKMMLMIAAVKVPGAAEDGLPQRRRAAA